jgi:hypothetical protein
MLCHTCYQTLYLGTKTGYVRRVLVPDAKFALARLVATPGVLAAFEQCGDD